MEAESTAPEAVEEAKPQDESKEPAAEPDTDVKLNPLLVHVSILVLVDILDLLAKVRLGHHLMSFYYPLSHG